jgi:hypothetical protein
MTTETATSYLSMLLNWTPFVFIVAFFVVLLGPRYPKGFARKGGLRDAKRFDRYEAEHASEVRWRGRGGRSFSRERQRSQSTHRGRSIEFLYRMKGSFRVKLSPNIRFNNPRGPHVSTDMDAEELAGKKFYLGKRTVAEVEVRGNVVVMYQVVGVLRRKGKQEWAHLTVYFGPAQGSEYY